MTETLKPQDEEQLAEVVAWAAAEEQPMDVVGGGSRDALGRPPGAGFRLDVSALSGVGQYEPAELVLSAAAATPLSEVEAALSEYRQHLAFEPVDTGPLLGGAGGTLGGAVAAGLAGPRRIHSGGVRDHLLGFRAISGRGEVFKAGGRVVKNVTGFDLGKLIAGSMGTLAVMTDITLKVLPAPEETVTVLVLGADDREAVHAMTEALGSAHDVTGAAHLPAAVARHSRVGAVAGAGGAVTAIRVEGPAPSVAARAAALAALLGRHGELAELDTAPSQALWREIRDGTLLLFEDDVQVWRVSVPPSEGVRIATVVAGATEAEVYYDWGGGLVWLALPPRPDAAHDIVRRAVGGNGHATLIRAPAQVRAAVPVFEPPPPPLAALSARVKDAFDPARVLNRGRMYADL